MTSYHIVTEDNVREIEDAELNEVTGGGYDIHFLGGHFYSMPSLATNGNFYIGQSGSYTSIIYQE